MKRWSIILSLLVVTTACDQGTKYLATEHLVGKGRISMAGDVFRLQYSENSGAFLSMGADLPDPVRKIIFTVLVAVILGGFLIYLLRSKELNRMSVIAGGLMVGGGIGNLIDRVFNDGAVVDFLNLGIGSLRTGIFNVADMAIMAGLFLFIFAGREHNKDDLTAPPASATGDAGESAGASPPAPRA